MTETTLNLDTALDQLAAADYDVPEAALRWLGENWTECGPVLIGMLRDFISGADRSERTTGALLFIMFMMAEQRDVAAFAPLCDVAALDIDLLDETFGDDWITATLSSLLTSTFDGDAVRLKDLIENHRINEYARSAALDAFIYLTLHEKIDREDAHAYLGDLFETLLPRSEHHIWTIWSMAIGWLGFEEYRDIVKTAFDRGYVAPMDMDYDDFERDLAKGLAQDCRAMRESEAFAPVDDAVAVLSTWYSFSEKRKKDEQDWTIRKLLAEDSVPLPPPSPGMKIGRNDPCPCGSGKKYKKCCLH